MGRLHGPACPVICTQATAGLRRCTGACAQRQVPTSCMAVSMLTVQTLKADLKEAFEFGQMSEEELNTVKKAVNKTARKGLSDMDPKHVASIKGEPRRTVPPTKLPVNARLSGWQLCACTRAHGMPARCMC